MSAADKRDEMWKDQCDAWRKRCEAKDTRIVALEAALHFYADQDSWNRRITTESAPYSLSPPVANDFGRIARTALGIPELESEIPFTRGFGQISQEWRTGVITAVTPDDPVQTYEMGFGNWVSHDGAYLVGQEPRNDGDKLNSIRAILETDINLKHLKGAILGILDN